MIGRFAVTKQHRRTGWSAALWAALLVGSAACSFGGASDSSDRAPGTWNPAQWRPPRVDSSPRTVEGAAILRGLALITHTRDSLPGYVGGNLNCTSCHLDQGRRMTAIPLLGVYARFPKYMDRTGALVPVEDRVNYCFTRSLAGSRLPSDSREMQDIVAYLAFISRGVPTGEHLEREGLAAMPALAGDSARGHAIFTSTCVPCHGVDGAGTALYPALWGAQSFSVGASLARVERAASFIRYNMPFNNPGSLTDQQALDVAAYITAMPRQDSPGKELDWPGGDAPADVPYSTRGHVAFHPPPLLPRRLDAKSALVAAPISLLHHTSR